MPNEEVFVTVQNVVPAPIPVTVTETVQTPVAVNVTEPAPTPVAVTVTETTQTPVSVTITQPTQTPVLVTIEGMAAGDAGLLTGSTLASNVVNSSLTSVGTLTSLAVTGLITASSFSGSHSGSGAFLTGIPNSATTATALNTANAIVSRDASGNFAVGTITGALSGNASTATTLQTARNINGTSFNGSADITTANWGTSRNITLGSTTKAVNGSANVSWTTLEIGVEDRAPLGVPRFNLGNPTVREMALFETQNNNKTAFFPISNIFVESSTDGTTWTTFSVTDQQKRRLVGGDFESSISIPYGTPFFRVRLRVTAAYVWVESLYSYFATNGHSWGVRVFRKHDSDAGWTQHTPSTATGNGWPGHIFLPFSTPIQWRLDGTQGTHDHEIYILFTPVWNPAYSANNISLTKIQLWGGYPAGRRTLYTTDELQNATFPATVTATTFSGAHSGSGALLTGIPASVLTGATLASGVTASSLTSLGTLTSTVNLATGVNLQFNDSAGTYPTNAGAFKWVLNNDGAEIYARQPASDQIDFVFKMFDNTNTTDRYIFWIDSFEGPTFDKYPIVADGTQVLLGMNSTSGSPDTANAALKVLYGATSSVSVNGTLTATTFSGSGASLTSLNATNISSGTIDNARTTATNANTVNTIVSRDASGNFTAGTITATTFTGALSGNASTATTLQTARLINGISFNGSADITVPMTGAAAANSLTGTTLATNVVTSSLTSVGTLTTLTVTGTITGSISGNAATATTLATARNINGVSFNGSANITVTAEAGTLTGATLASNVVASSLTSVGVLTGLSVAGTILGQSSAGAGDVLHVGDDSKLVDINVANTLGVYGVQDSTVGSIKFGSGGGTISGSGGNITFTGSATGSGYVGATSGALTSTSSLAAGAYLGTNDVGSGRVLLTTGTAAEAWIWANGAGTLVAANNGTQRVLIDGSGNLSVLTPAGNIRMGTWAPNTAYSGIAGPNGYVLFGQTADTNTYLRGSAAGLRLGDTGADRIVMNGTVMSMALSATASLSGYQYMVQDTTFGIIARFTSSARFKENIVSLEDSGLIIDALRPVSFVAKAKEESESESERAWRLADIQHGFIAEEVAEIDGGRWAVWEPDEADGLRPIMWRQPDIIALLVAEVKNLRFRLDVLESV